VVTVSRNRRSAKPAVDDDDEEEEKPRTTVRRRRDEVKTRRRPVEDDSDVNATDIDDDEDDEEEEEKPRSRRAAPAKKRTRVVDDDDDDDDEEDEEEERPRARKTSAAKKRSRVVNDDDEEDDDDEEEEEKPRIRSRRAKGSPPPGIRTGLAGAEQTLKSGGGFDRVALTNEPELIKILKPESILSYRQHWVSTDGKDRPYTCLGSDCPLCDMGDPSTATYGLNVLHLSGGDRPKVKLLQIGTRAFQALKEAATDKRTNKIRMDKDFWAVQRSGKRQQTQTNFRPVKERDIEEDWAEVLEFFDLDELPELIEKAERNLYDWSIIQVSTKKQLREIAGYLSEED
jgi:hypothetical protein